MQGLFLGFLHGFFGLLFLLFLFWCWFWFLVVFWRCRFGCCLRALAFPCILIGLVVLALPVWLLP
jgi:hypothetical protein